MCPSIRDEVDLLGELSCIDATGEGKKGGGVSQAIYQSCTSNNRVDEKRVI